jgi:hypothetical protein
LASTKKHQIVALKEKQTHTSKYNHLAAQRRVFISNYQQHFITASKVGDTIHFCFGDIYKDLQVLADAGVVQHVKVGSHWQRVG